jgi:hypothetical protein
MMRIFLPLSRLLMGLTPFDEKTGRVATQMADAL